MANIVLAILDKTKGIRANLPIKSSIILNNPATGTANIVRLSKVHDLTVTWLPQYSLKSKTVKSIQHDTHCIEKKLEVQWERMIQVIPIVPL